MQRRLAAIFAADVVGKNMTALPPISAVLAAGRMHSGSPGGIAAVGLNLFCGGDVPLADNAPPLC